jgi:hypothetical protein
LQALLIFNNNQLTRLRLLSSAQYLDPADNICRPAAAPKRAGISAAGQHQQTAG